MKSKFKKYIRLYIIILFLLLSFGSCRRVVIRIDKIPSNTPRGAAIYISGNFNYWDPGDQNYQLKLNKDSSYFIELPMILGDIEYKFTRGDWSTVEKDKCGLEIENRTLQSSDNENVTCSIESWADLDPINCDSITIVLEHIPPNTPGNEKIKIAGNFNAWNPGNDSNYVIKRNTQTGELSVTIPRDPNIPLGNINYKIVRGDSLKSEADKFGEQIEKRQLEISKEGKVVIKVENWEDLALKRANTVTIVLKEIPQNTPEWGSIYLVGNFNDWQTSDQKYKFIKNPQGKYSITIPRKKYGLSFKITRGGWDTQAADSHGHELGNADYNYADIDTLYLTIENWWDLARGNKKAQTIVIQKVPANTPSNAKLYMATNYNGWNPKNEDYVFKKDNRGYYLLNVLKGRDNLEYKITRGDWESEELDINGEKIENRKIRFRDSDTVYITVEMWQDLIDFSNYMVTVEVIKIPRSTPENAKIYIAGEFNGWDPGDKKYILKSNGSGKYTIQLPGNWLRHGFKFTRGSWESVETDHFGDFVENRIYKGKADKVQIEIANWEDR